MELWNTFWKYVEALPEGPKSYALGSIVTIIGVLLASTIAVLGVRSTNKTNRKNLQAQLEHDGRMRTEEHAHELAMRAKEHELSLRKQIYLDAAEAIAMGMGAITSMQDVNRTPLQVREAFSQRAPSLGRLHVVASEEVALRFAQLYRELDSTYLRLRVERIPLDDIRERMLQHVEKRNRYYESCAKVGDILRNEHLAGTMNAERLATLDAFYQRETSLAVKEDEARLALASGLQRLHYDYTLTCYAEHARLSKMTLPLIAAVRRDMGVLIDEETYAEVLKPKDVDHQLLRKLFRLSNDTPVAA